MSIFDNLIDNDSSVLNESEMNNHMGGFRYFLQPDVVKDIKKPFKEKTSTNTTEFGSETNDIKDVDVSITDSISGYFNTNFKLDRDPLNNVNDLIVRYRKVSELSYVADAIDEIVCEAIIRENDESDIVSIGFNDKADPIADDIQGKIREEFANILDLLDFDDQGQDYFKQWYIDGRCLFQIILKKDEKGIQQGIQKIKLMSPLYLKRFYDEKKRAYFYIYDDKKMKNSRNVDVVGLIPDELVVFVPSGKYETEKKVPLSYLHTAIKDVQRLDTLEDHMLIYRISRAPERRVFYVDPGNLPPKKAEEYLQKIISTYRQKKVWDDNEGTLSAKVKHPSMIEDFFLLRRNGKATEIDTLAGGDALSQIEDLYYFNRKAMKSLKVPFSRLNFEDRQLGVSPTGNDITREEMKFDRYIKFLRYKFNVLFFELLKKQLVLKGIIEPNEWASLKRKLVFIYKTDTQFIEAKRLQTIEAQLNVLRDIEDYKDTYFSKEYIQKNVLQLTKEEIDEMDNQIMEDKAKEGENY
jgi:hypothetical protein